MPSEREYALSVAQLREVDRCAIAALGGDALALMTRAGEAAFRRIRARWPEARRWRIYCGRGNNGGDGWVVAALARAAGLAAHVIAVPGEPASAEALAARSRALAAGVPVLAPGDAAPPADLVVDAVLGIGATRAPEGAVRALIETVAATPAPVVALDLPSGLDADTGAAPGAVVRATLSICFIALKPGLLTGAGPELAGEVALERLGVAEHCWPPVGQRIALTGANWPRSLLPPRAVSAHKGQHGHVLAIGGEQGYAGAIRLAGEAALRAGAGLVSVATRAAHAAVLVAARPELMVRGVDEPAALRPLIERASVIAIGPGLGQGPWAEAMLEMALGAGRSLVLDADALNLLARRPARLPPGAVLTPHPGEAARLLGVDVGAVQRDRLAAVRALADRYGAVALLKGAGTVIAAPGRLHALVPVACPALASAGMGDVLTGVIAALLAQGLAPDDAAALGADAHARAGLALAARHGTRGVLALDLAAALPAWLGA